MINQGVSFGLRVPIWLVGLGLLTVLLIFYRDKRGRVGLGLLALGGTMNLVSRVLYGGVVDNMILWGILYNNLADYLIFFGVVWYGYTYFVRRHRHSSHREAKRDDK